MIQFKLLNSRATLDHLGLIPYFFDESDPRPAKEQIHEAYAHGGGWFPLAGWQFDRDNKRIKYPGDRSLAPFAFAQLRDEQIYVYPGAWVNIVTGDQFEVSRID